MKLSRLAGIALLILLPVSANGQPENFSDLSTSVAENFAGDEADPSFLQIYNSELSELREQPVNLNSASGEELSELFFLSDFQVKSLLDYVRSNGRIYSVYEIANIPGFNREMTELLMPFIILETENKSVHRTRLKGSVLSNFILSNDGKDTSSIGSGLKYLGRYKITSGGFTLGITTEKDRGERFIYGSPALPDFFSGFLSFTGEKAIRNIIIGDFSGRFGNGLSVNSGMASMQSLTSTGFSTSARGFRGYSSTDENSFFRGIAATFAIENILFSVFYSSNKLDATSDPSGKFITSFYTAGLHNTASLTLKRDVVTMDACGMNIAADIRRSRVGVVYTRNKLSIPMAASNEPERRFRFEGDHNEVLSVYYSSVTGRTHLFGEGSIDGNYNTGFNQGISISPSGRLKVNLLGSLISPGFSSLNGRSAFTGSATWNERSISGNFTFELLKSLFLSAGCMITDYPWIKQGCAAPSVSVKKEIRLKYTPSDDMSLEAIFNNSKADKNSDEINRIPSLISSTKNHFRTTFRYYPSPYINLGTRIDCTFTGTNKRGYAMMQDLSMQYGKIPVSIWLRVCLYSTGDWDTRIYAYENDLLYSFSIPALYGEGSRNYIMLRYKPAGYVDLRLKYGITSGKLEGQTNNDTDFRVQLKISF